ncbi:hypothetical protein GCM10008995_06500 [Halobellus salinus]|uniref:CARDB domain-containing protein n=1 Tax=Halobellus salinus TaxID=931585 RepID=A0A830E8D4_9EURY|nr:hypothetical protein GCM10008995_06500 [Halobellus salinus]
MTVAPDDPNTGEQVTIEATISNLENSDTTVEVTDLYVRTPGTTEEFARGEDVGSIAPGGTLSVPVSTTFETAGKKRLDVNLGVRDEDGAYHSYTYPVYIDVSEPTVKADLSATTSRNTSGTTEVSLTNFGNTNLSNVEITATANGELLDRNFVYEVPPESSGTTAFDTGDVDADAVEFTAMYTAAGDTHNTSLTVDIDEETRVPGEVRLTAIEASQAGTGVTIQGDAANLGSTDAGSVLVRIGDADDVRPAPPSGEYFVGAVEASEFATFELTAQADANVSSIPVEITYIVDNERVTTTQRVDLTAGGPVSSNVGAAPGGAASGDGPGGPGSDGSGGLPLQLVGGAVVVASIVGGVALYRWRSR